MADLNLSVAVGNYDRMRPLIEGAVQIDGVAPTFLKLDPEEIFFRAFRHADFDVCELSLSSFSVKTAAGTCPYVGVPVFPSRAFRHTSIYIRTDRGIKTPADLKGKRIGEGRRPQAPHRHVGDEGHTAVRRGAIARRAEAAGRRFLVLRLRSEPPHARTVPEAASRGGALLPPS
jgi:hypothetical protein